MRCTATLLALAFCASSSAQAKVTVIHSHRFRHSEPGTLVADPAGNLYGTTSETGGSVFRVASDGSGFTILHAFAGGATDGALPLGALLLDGAGNLYGTTVQGGTWERGTIFRLGVDGTGFTVLHSFAGGSDDGANPESALILDAAGKLYGTSAQGGAWDQGTVFSMRSDGTGFTVLHAFAGGAADAANPKAPVVLDVSGGLYGTAGYGGPDGAGAVFTVGTDGSGYAVLHFFSGGPGPGGSSDGGNPYAGLVTDGAGNLFGATLSGGAGYAGTVFSVRTDGSGYTILHSFLSSTADGLDPAGALLLSSSGNLYGTAVDGGASGKGTIFTLKKSGSGFAVLHSFAGGAGDGANPYAGLVAGPSGKLFGVTSLGGPADAGTVFSIRPTGAAAFHLVYSFDAGLADGTAPEAALVPDAAGTLYGTTRLGGAYGFGTVFRVGPDGSGFAVLHSFAGAVDDGAYPYAPLVADGGGNLYGTTAQGGGSYSGTLFTLRTDGTGYGVLHSFGPDAAAGVNPYSGLVLDGSGTLYGVAAGGGGILYSIHTDGSAFAVLHAFGDDANTPIGALTLDGAGNVYGTTSSDLYGHGAVFTLRTDGTGWNVLHTFSGGADGDVPLAGLVQDSAGVLYGTAEAGGSAGRGVVYRLGSDGSAFTVLHSFGTTIGDGSFPTASLVLDASGDLFGTTLAGGAPSSLGTLFKVRTDGSAYATLHAFSGGEDDGATPAGSLHRDATGDLYGTTRAGGAWDQGAEVRFSFDRGDANGDGLVDVSDVFYLVRALFSGGRAPIAEAAGDVNGDGKTTTSDVLYLIAYLFAGGPPPP